MEKLRKLIEAILGLGKEGGLLYLNKLFGFVKVGLVICVFLAAVLYIATVNAWPGLMFLAIAGLVIMAFLGLIFSAPISMMVSKMGDISPKFRGILDVSKRIFFALIPIGAFFYFAPVKNNPVAAIGVACVLVLMYLLHQQGNKQRKE